MLCREAFGLVPKFSLLRRGKTWCICILCACSLVPRPCGRKEKWPGIHCYCIPSFTIDLYRIALMHVRHAQAYLANIKARTLIKRSGLLFVVLEWEISR